MIPKAWKLAEIGDWLDEYRDKSTIQNQYAVLTSSRSGLIPQSEYYGDSRITTRDNIGFHVIPDRYITYRSRSDDGLFFFNRNETGKAGLISHYYPVFRFPLGSDDFFLATLNFWRHKFGAYAVGSSQKVLSLNALQSVKIPIPPLAEQKRIAEILSTWDRAIETTEKLIANSEAQKKALVQQLLTGKKRLPGFKGEWRTKKLSEFCTVRRGASPRPIDSPKWFAQSGRGWVRISDVTKSNDETLEHTDQYLSSEGAANSVAVDPGDLIMSICATIGVPKFLGIPACIHDGFVVFREVSPRLALPFLFYVLEAATERLANRGQPGTQKNLNTSIVGEILVPDIKVAEQLAIAERLKSADKILRYLSDKLKIFRAEKASLMQQLLTGKRRVKIKGEAQAA